MKTHETKITVRYSETDQMKRVYYSRYLEWFELGRAEHLKAAGFPYSDMEKQGTFLVVADTYIKYIKPAHYEEEVIIKTIISEVSKASVTFEYEIKNSKTKELLVTGNSKLASVTKDGKVTYIPDIIRGKIKS
ncbi:acyl-CoA thioesterase [Candidatus Margulisiibacteriota bacterium]